MEKRRKKVLLIDPPGFNGLKVGRVLGSFGTNKADQVWPPYDLQIIAGYCKKNNHGYKILDANNLNLTCKEIKNEIEKYAPDWIVYLTCFQTFKLDAKIAVISKQINKRIKTACISLSIFSVQNPAKQMEELPDLDFIIWGEPEFPLIELINGKKPQKVKGVYYRNKGKIKFSGKAEKPKSLDEFGIPVHSCMNYKIYKCPMAIRLPMAVVSCSRGCINQCVHCQAGSFQRPIRYRPIENVLKELDELKSLGVKEIKFWDASLLSNLEFTEELCKKMIEKKYGFAWHCNARAEFVNPKILDVMKKAGCHTVAIGCESSNAEILKNMGKNESPEEIKKAIKLIKKHRMRVLIYMTFGLEGETEKTMKETYNFAKKLNPEFVTFGVVVPAPGTPFYDSLKKKGYLINKDLELQDPNSLPAFSYPHLSPNKIHEFARSAYRNYYFRPAYILMRLNKLRSLDELKISFTNALSVVKRYCFEEVR